MRSEVQIFPDPPVLYGAIAQLGEHLLCKQGVVGSIPTGSTIFLDVIKTDFLLRLSVAQFFNNSDRYKQHCINFILITDVVS